MEFQIASLEDIPDAICHGMERLYAQLSTKRLPVPVREALATGQTTMAYCTDGGEVIGMASLATYPALSGQKGWVEDVVVDKAYRNRGVGRRLMEMLLEEARSRGVHRIMLYTEFEKEAALHLYRSLGFELRDSQVLQYYLQEGKGGH